jgi:hypothetical protein
LSAGNVKQSRLRSADYVPPSGAFNLNSVPAIRIRDANSVPVLATGRYVLYWMIATRRLRHNFALHRALEHCRQLQEPLRVFEALGCGSCQEWLHLPQTKVKARVGTVDSNGLLPIRAAAQAFGRAFDFRRFLQENLPAHLRHGPSAKTLLKSDTERLEKLPEQIVKRWPPAVMAILAKKGNLQNFPIDHSVSPTETRGGTRAAIHRMRHFFDKKLQRYGELRNHPELDMVSGFSPYLHFGHLSVHEVFSELVRREKWKPQKLSLHATGSREGWWNMSSAADVFLDEIITWRELGYNFASHRDDYDTLF